MIAKSLQGVIEEGKDAPVVVEHQRPIEHLSGGVDDADPLGRWFGAANLLVETTFRIDGRIIQDSKSSKAMRSETSSAPSCSNIGVSVRSFTSRSIAESGGTRAS